MTINEILKVLPKKETKYALLGLVSGLKVILNIIKNTNYDREKYIDIIEKLIKSVESDIKQI